MTRPAWPTSGTAAADWPGDTADVIADVHASFDGQVRGLAPPNPAASLLLPAPTVMASPPTITPGAANAATAIANSALYAPWNGKGDVFSFFGGDAPIGASFPDDNYWSPGFRAGAVHICGNFAVEFEWYGQAFELMLKGTNARYMLIVDGKYDARQGREDTTADGNAYLIKYDFGSVAFRRIRFEFGSDVAFGGIRIGPNDSIWKSNSPRGPKVVITGDSFTELFWQWPQMMSWLLGWRDFVITGAGSTGYLDTNIGYFNWGTLRQRAPEDIYPYDPDIVIVSGGINDQAYDPADVQAEAETFYAEIRATLPNATLIVSGYQWVNGSPDAVNVQLRDAIRAAAESVGVDLYIEQIGGPYPYDGNTAHYVDAGWMTGTGRVGATTGSGNSDIFRDTDSTHPTQVGHDYRGFRHAQAIAAAMPIIGS